MSLLKYEKEESIAKITLSRPKALNALNNEMLAELRDVFGKIKTDKDILSVIITGEGEKSFVAGADISEMKDLDERQGYKFGLFGSDIFKEIERAKVPVIASINGYALGGGLELALACDLRIASEDAIFGFPEVGLGIIPGYGGTQRLPRIIGISKAKRLLFTAERIDAGQALKIGLVDIVVPKGELSQKTMELAKRITSQAPVAVAAAKEAVDKGMDLKIDKAFALASRLFSGCFKTQDQKRAMAAFIKKEKFTKFENK